jgi:predicted nucleic acid-binding protein
MRYGVDAETVLRLLEEELEAAAEHRLVAPALLRSAVLSRLHEAVHAGELDAKTARARLERFNRLKIRYLNDKVSRSVAWQLADELGWPGTYKAEYLAVTRLQADALVALDEDLRRAAAGIVPIADFGVLLAG